MPQNSDPNTHTRFFENELFIQWRISRTPELDAYWARFRRENPDLSEPLDIAIEKFSSVSFAGREMSHNQFESLWKRIDSTGKSTKSQLRVHRKHLLQKISIAASLFIIIATGAIIYMAERNTGLPAAPITGERYPQQDICLTAGKNMVALDRDAEISVDSEGNIIIADHLETLPSPKNKPNKLVVPYGKRATVTLADGTVAWVNSGTEVEFPSEFTGRSREITVSGEVYLDVAYDDAKPFIVHSKDFSVRVLGTSFNMAAYADEANNSVVLVDGKVRLEKKGKLLAEMSPSEMALFESGKISNICKVDVAEYISWKDNMLLLDGTTIADILRKIGRYYNVSFEINDTDLSGQTCTGKLYLASNIDDIMLALTVISNTSYRREDSRIFITPKNNGL